eukprot:2401418-Rhodomonas_salina.1
MVTRSTARSNSVGLPTRVQGAGRSERGGAHPGRGSARQQRVRAQRARGAAARWRHGGCRCGGPRASPPSAPPAS